MENENYMFSGERNQPMFDVETVKVAPEGLGFGEGSISYQNRKEQIGEEALQRVDELIHTGEILVPVSKDKNGQIIDDDGCGDGRSVARTFEGGEERKRSLQRSKVFGGGTTMAVASSIGLGRLEGTSLRDAFSDGISSLRDKQIDFGAHTDTHAHDGNCGCGAIDKAPRIIENVTTYESEIRATIEALGISTEGLDDVLANYRVYGEAIKGQPYAGADVMSEIVDNGKIVKELDDNHKEVVVVLNMTDGMTVNQEKVREVSGSEAQAFAVDVWRVKELAERLYKDESDETRHQAFLGELAYTLATAGTLTNGDLPVYVVSKQPELVAA